MGPAVRALCYSNGAGAGPFPERPLPIGAAATDTLAEADDGVAMNAGDAYYSQGS